MNETTTPTPTPSASVAGPARRCEWILAVGRKVASCPAVATRLDPSTGGALCPAHAEDYEEIFGDVLVDLPPNDSCEARRNGQ